jgi:hypothetical protein
MAVMYFTWALFKRTAARQVSSESSRLLPDPIQQLRGSWWFTDLVDFKTVDLDSDQYEDEEADKHDEEQRAGRTGIWQRLYYWLA